MCDVAFPTQNVRCVAENQALVYFRVGALALGCRYLKLLPSESKRYLVDCGKQNFNKYFDCMDSS